ncbi:MAG: XdhC family protein [Gammaproteobacteria bacterium]|nr:XdhC family protein [Gammaproteobacteria bacterium]MCZ6584564.1 XdhC family protein [Gammaproteobacteria bacterium]
MKRDLLERLVAAQTSNRPAVLARSLSGNSQFLLDSGTDSEPPDGVPAEVLREARRALKRDGARTIEVAGQRYLLQTLSPPPRLLVIGAVHIAQALIPMARVAGYDVQLIDPRAAFATRDRFPGIEIINQWPQEVMDELPLNSRTAVVTLSHDAKIDEPALKAALESDAFYIGALGSKKNHAKRLQRLAALGFDDETLARIAGPVGLPLGGRSPAEIAVSILAQIIQSRYQSS